jgi:hypothetical protein
MRHQPEVADADESRRQHVQQVSTQEFIDRKRHETLFVLVGGIAPTKCDHAIGQLDESMVGNRHTMGVLAKITKRVLGAPEWAFCVNHPVGAEKRAKPRGEGLRILQRGEGSMEGDFVLRVQRFEAIHELAPEHFFEYVNRQKEVLLRVDPPRMVWRQTAGGNHAMNVRMMLELLIPGVEDAEEPDLGAETLRIAGDLKQGLGAGPE